MLAAVEEAMVVVMETAAAGAISRASANQMTRSCACDAVVLEPF
jgi:hypothetical protein